jgi:hypothetical protein
LQRKLDVGDGGTGDNGAICHNINSLEEWEWIASTN